MSTIISPQPITTTLQHVSPVVDRECFLVAKKTRQGLTEDERQELARIYADVGCSGLSCAEVDQLAELHSEGRTFPVQHVNFKE
jgi:hypothetical protein